MSQQDFVNQRILIVMLARNPDRNVGITKRDWSKGGNPEDNKNAAQSRRQKNAATSPPCKKRKKPYRNVGNRSKSEVIHEETVVLHKEAVRRQPRSPQGGS